MKNFAETAKKSFADMADISFKMIHYGVKFAFVLLCAAVVMCLAGRLLYGYSSERDFANAGLALAAVSVFAQFFIAGIVFDILKKRQN